MPTICWSITAKLHMPTWLENRLFFSSHRAWYSCFCFNFVIISTTYIPDWHQMKFLAIISTYFWPVNLKHHFSLGHEVKWSEVKWVKSLSRVRLFATPWTVAYQAPPSMGFSRQEYRSELPFPSPGDLPDPGIELWSPAFQADALTSEPPGKPRWGIVRPFN